jgi:hypothetical protein
MPRFRPVDPRLAGRPVTPEAVRRLAAEVIAAPHFFVAPDLDLEWAQFDREETSWEIFRGRLLDPAHTRERAVFESWNVYEKTADRRSDEPLLSLNLDAAAGVLYVVRGLECYVWEGYDSGGGVILSRERRKWVRELVATLRLDQFADLDELRDEMICGLYHAVVGTSRLPLTSVEAPLPAFSFGRLFYWFREDSQESWDELFRALLPRPEGGKLLQTYLFTRRFEETTVWEFVDLLGDSRALRHEILTALEAMFNDASLSPWTNLTERMLLFLGYIESTSVVTEEQVIDFLAGLLRKIGRHLTSYDLVTFHHRGANYPDALLLDAVLKKYLVNVTIRPDHFLDADEGGPARRVKRLRRRALRQGWVVRRRYEGHPVPDSPTSPGENNRVLPPSHPRVPEEQVLQTARRTRRLYDGDPLTKYLTPDAAAVLRQSVADLSHPAELQELGVGLFLDRPLAADKAPGEPDASPLFSGIAFSRSTAVQRIHALAREEILAEQKPSLDDCLRALLESPPRGLPLDRIGGVSRPGAVSLTDARLASPDFEFLQSTMGAFITLFRLFDFSPLQQRFEALFPQITRPLFVRDPSGPGFLVYNDRQRLCMELEVDRTRGFVRRAGVEYPAGGLLVKRVWEETADGSLREHDLRAAPIRLPPQP